MGVIALQSCSETDESSKEFENWKERNDAFFKSIYSKASSEIQNGNSNWKIIDAWSLTSDAINNETNRIVVEVIKEGSGTECPILSDTVRVHYEGRLMPTESSEAGYKFDGSWSGDYNDKTMIPSKFALNGVVDGFTAALLHMHTGDRWRVFIPYTLGYKKNAQGSIPGYSTLIFDLTLHSYGHPGTPMPAFK